MSHKTTFNEGVRTDNINEITADSGVTLDSVNLKDGTLNLTTAAANPGGANTIWQRTSDGAVLRGDVELEKQGDVVGPVSSVDNTLPRFDATTGKLIQSSSVVVDDSDNVLIPSTAILDAETIYSGQYQIFNSKHTAATEKTGGTVTICEGTAIQNAVAAGGFATTSTLVTDDATTFTTGDIILVTDANNFSNNGLYEVASYVTGTITIDTTPVEDFSKSAFVVDTTIAGVVTKVMICVNRTGGGVFQTGSGSVVPITYNTISNDNVYVVEIVNAATFTITTEEVILVDYTATGACTITLPTAGSRKTLKIVDSGGNSFANNITVTSAGSDTINGNATYIINGDDNSINLINDGGTRWFIV